MNEAEFENRVLENVITTEDATKLLNLIDTLLNNLYESDADAFNKTLESKAQGWFAEIIHDLKKAGKSRQEFLKKLTKSVKDLKKVQITIRSDPNEQLKKVLKDWVDVNLGTKVIAEFEVKKSVLGGAVVSFNGKYIDHSLEKRLDGVLTKMKPGIIKSLNQENIRTPDQENIRTPDQENIEKQSNGN